MYKFILLLLICLNTYSVEEKNSIPFFYLNGKNKLRLKFNDTQICRITSKDVLEVNEYKVFECYFLDKNFSSKLKQVIKENSKKKEVQLIFLKNQVEKLKPVIQNKEQTFFINSIVYYRKTKSYHLELFNSKGEYYFFNFEPEQLQIENAE